MLIYINFKFVSEAISELKMHQICEADATKKQSLIMGDYFYFVFLVSLALFTNSHPYFLPVRRNCDDSGSSSPRPRRRFGVC
jgi:hypothetical protein